MKKVGLVIVAICVALLATWILKSGQEPQDGQLSSTSKDFPLKHSGDIPAVTHESRAIRTSSAESRLLHGELAEESRFLGGAHLPETPHSLQSDAMGQSDRRLPLKDEDAEPTREATVEEVLVALSTFFEAGYAGDVQAAEAVCVAGCAEASKAPKLRGLVSDSEELPFDVYADEKAALAVSSAVDHADEPNEPAEYLVFFLKKGETGKWLVADIDDEDYEGAEKEIESFLELSNDGRLLTQGPR